MRTVVRRTATLAVLGALAVGSSLPAAAQSGQLQSLSQRQSILTELSPTGEAGTSRVFTQLKATGSGPVTVTLPQQATEGLRNLDGFGKPDVNGEDVVWSLDASEDGTARSVADNTAELPVSVSVVYALDGEEIAPDDLAGRTGRVTVEYTVRNLTAEPREVISFDAENNKFTETMDVAVPMVGSLSLTLPPNFANIDAPGAVTAGDGRGSTVVNYSLLLFAPLGAEEQVVTWTADAVETAIPMTSLQVLPVDDRSFNSLNATAEAYKGASGSLSELANGALIINSNLLLLGSGASQLLDGLNQLSDGADQLSDGLANTAAPGARQLSDGMSAAREGGGKLSTGLGELALGATRLSDGLGSAEAGGTKLSAGLGDLAAGATRLSGGLGDAAAGGTKLSTGLGDLADGASQIADGTSGLRAGLGDLRTGILGKDGLFASILGGIEQIRAGAVPVLEATPGLEADEAPKTLVDGLIRLAGTERAGLTDPTGLFAAVEGLGSLQTLTQTLYVNYQASRANLASAVSATSVTAQGMSCLGDASAEPPVPATCTIDDLLRFSLGTLPEGHPAIGLLTGARGGLAQVNTGLTGSLTSLGPDTGAFPGALAQCETVINKLKAFSVGAGLQPTGLESLLASHCITRGLADGVGGAAEGAVALRDNAVLLGQGLDTGLNQFRDQVKAGEKQLTGVFGAEKIQGETLLNGIARLDAGAGLVAGGAGTASAGSQDLVAGLRQLADGGGQLAAGAGTASAGSGDLADGLRQLAAGGGQLAAGAGTAASGSRDLASGLVQLDDGAGKLADGLGDAADGSTKLAEGLGSAEEGGEKIAGGVGQLQEGFEERLIGGISGGRQGASQDHEQVKAVIARGREGAAPYGIAEGADATTVFQFDLAGVGSEEGPSTPLMALLAMVALAGASGLGLTLKRRLVA